MYCSGGGVTDIHAHEALRSRARRRRDASCVRRRTIRGPTLARARGHDIEELLESGYGISSDARCKIADADGGGDNLVCGWKGLLTELIRYAISQMATALARKIVTGIKLRLSAK
jgi:hypothetical protein